VLSATAERSTPGPRRSRRAIIAPDSELFRTIKAEFLKLRTTRLPFGLFGIAVGVTTAITIMAAARPGVSGPGTIGRLSTAVGQREAVTNTGFALLMAMIFGVTVATSEFRHHTATFTFLAIPSRIRVLVAKSITAAAVGSLFGLAAALPVTGVGVAFIAADGYHLTVSAGSMARFVAGAFVGAGLLAVAGVGIGSLIRSQVVSVMAAFCWVYAVELILAGVFPAAAPYLPYTAATTLAGAVPKGSTPLPFGAAVAVAAGATAVILAVAAWLTVRRDVT
jgi:hypothetical protein